MLTQDVDWVKRLTAVTQCPVARQPDPQDVLVPCLNGGGGLYFSIKL